MKKTVTKGTNELFFLSVQLQENTNEFSYFYYSVIIIYCYISTNET